MTAPLCPTCGVVCMPSAVLNCRASECPMRPTDEESLQFISAFNDARGVQSEDPVRAAAVSELQKYYVYADCTCGMGNPSTEEEANSVHGKHYRVADVEAARAADKARIELLQRAVEWLYGLPELLVGNDGERYLLHCATEVQRATWVEIPVEFADIIKVVKP